MSEEKKEEKVLQKNAETSLKDGAEQVAESKEEGLILGKFKTVEDLKTAYQNLQKQQGEQSEELGSLRKLQQALQIIANKKSEEDLKLQEELEYINNNLSKYDNDNYFKNDAFKTLYGSAYKALGTGLDTDAFVDMIEKYVASRLLLNEQIKNAEAENKNVTDGLDFAKGVTKNTEKKLRFQDVPPSEYRKYLAKYI